MENIEAIYIINGKSQLVFSYEIIHERSENFDYSNISRFFSIIKTFALKFGETEVNIIELGNSKLFKINDDDYNIDIIIKCNKNFKEKKASIKLKTILNLFLNSFIGYFNSSMLTKKERMDVFMKEISFIVEENGKMKYFLENININS